MKSFNSKMRKKIFRKTVGDEVAKEIDKQTEVFDLMKERLKAIGFDYDKEVKELTEGADNEQRKTD